MSQVGLHSAHLWYPVGSGEILHSFFSTVCLELEGSVWGSHFPVLMNDLYGGFVDASLTPKAAREHELVLQEFSLLPPSLMVWDCEDPSLAVPVDYLIGINVSSLADCFVTSENERLVDLLGRALRRAVEENQGISLTTLDVLQS